MPLAPQPRPILTPAPDRPPWAGPRLNALPGAQPLAEGDWLWVLGDYAAQMAERERLLDAAPEAVIAQTPQAAEAVAELYAIVLDELARTPGFRREGPIMRRPDDRAVALDAAAPLATLGRLTQQDFCVLQKPAGEAEHVLTAAVLCFPSHWSLGEKIGRPMARIHRPVARYDAEVARRVQRLMDGVRPGRPIWRANGLLHADFALFAPQREAERHERPATDGPKPWFRSERQVLLRLPQTDAVVFSIQTLMTRATDAPR
jgi:hypothetical protein